MLDSKSLKSGGFKAEGMHTTMTAITLSNKRVHQLDYVMPTIGVGVLSYSQDMRTDKYPGVEEDSFWSGLSAIQFWREKMRDVLMMEC